VSGPGRDVRPPGSAALVRLVAGREVAVRIRDKAFIISSAVLVVLVLGGLAFQVAVASSAGGTTVGVVGDPALGQALTAQGEAVGVDVTTVALADDAAARRAVDDGDVDGALTGDPASPRLLVQRSPDPQLLAVVQGAVSGLSVQRQLAAAGAQSTPPPPVTVVPLRPTAADTGQRTVVALVGVVVLYGLLVLFGQFVAQGVVEEKSSRVVEVLLATLRPWQLLAGKIVGLGLLGLLQIALIVVIGVAGALVSGVVDTPGVLVGTGLSVVGWFVLGYAFYASVFAATASLVSRQEDLGTVLTPTTLVLVAAFVIAVQAGSDPTSGLAAVTSFVPGLSPLVMPVRAAAGEAAWWEVGISALLMVGAVVLVVRLGGRVYAGAVLRTGGRTRIREALRAERV
jgi:ABC-2 type transport system permease protein